MKTVPTTNSERQGTTSWEHLIAQQVKSLRFGVVQITVHDSKVVQIERTEKIRVSEYAQPNQTQSA